MFAHPRRAAAPRAAFGIVLFAAAVLVPATPAPAQGLLGAIFDALGGGTPVGPPPPAYADPGRPFDPMDSHSSPARPAPGAPGGGTYCVRLCDGRFFPIAHNARTDAARLCTALCPASRTRIFRGSTIAHAVAADGSRYAALDSAFLYRERVVPDCTCNGRDPFGLARIDVTADPTLRPGDIVATGGGLLAYEGSRRRGTAANFTPIDRARLSRDLRAKLADIDVARGN